MKTIHPKMRNKVGKGCGTAPSSITFEYLHDHGMSLNWDTLKRQGRDDSTSSQPARRARLGQAGQHIEGASAWGAFVGDQLAAYIMTFVINGIVDIARQSEDAGLSSERRIELERRAGDLQESL